jgi:cytochrome b subunit of formate dehydrogenase
MFPTSPTVWPVMIRTACTRTTHPSLIAALLLVLLAAVSNGQDVNARCQRCHAEPWISERSPAALAAMVRAPESGSHELRNADELAGLYVPNDTFLNSAHGALNCEQCHTDIQSLPHSQSVATISCSKCHEDEAHEVTQGLHDPAKKGTPDCADCHGNAHITRRTSDQRTYDYVVEMVERCSECHSDVGEAGFDPAGTFHDSIHGEAIFRLGLVQGPLCTDCHGTHTMAPLSDPASPLYFSNVSNTCGSCHQGVVNVFAGSVHGQNVAGGRKDAATCTSCHHSHGVKQVTSEFLSDVVAECSNCHLELGASYLRSYHGKASQLGDTRVAVCSKCHGAHDILPADHADSRVAKENLKETCAECHPDANDNFVGYIAHVDYMDTNEHPAVFFTFWGMTILLCSVLLVFVPHSLLWFQRTLVDRLRNPAGHAHRKPRMVRRFSLLHRITHGLIVVSFLGLVATGFPLKYSYTQWAQRLTETFGGIHAMGTLHRFFAILTFVYVTIHLIHLAIFFWKKCPTPRWRYIIGPDSMLLKPKDFFDFIAMVKWFFRLGPRPRFGRWTYFEKFDYWGEIWGVILIGGSGLMLWYPTFFTKVLPGWSLNVAMVIHSIEALLAASVIFLVHFFNTHLRPEKFPIDMTMWTGQISEEELKEERPELYERLVESKTLEQEIVQPMPLRWRVLGVVLGISAFLVGIGLIILAIRTELLNVLH